MTARSQLTSAHFASRISGKLENVQHLRALAAIIVVFEHTLHRGEWYGQSAQYALTLKGLGLSGVDIFFVISGFVMVCSQLRSPKGPAEFLVGRLLRIVPLYWSLTLSLVLLVVVVPSVFRTLSFDDAHVTASLLFISQATLNQAPFIDVGWTLEWEMLFYVLFATTLLTGTLERQLISISLLLLIVAIALDRYFALEFVLGMIAAYLMVHRDLRTYGPLLFTVGAIALMSDTYFDWGADRLLVWGGPAFLMVLGAAVSIQRENQFCSYLGAASYSIYLVQVASIPLFYKFSSRFLSNVQGDFLAVGCVVWSVVVGCILHSLFEKPVTETLRNLTRRDRRKPVRV